LEKIGKTELAKKFYLARETALAIQLGHRESIDLDWFSGLNIKNDEIREILSSIGKFNLLSESEGTAYGNLDGVMLSFFRYKYKLLFPKIAFDSVKLADSRDIAAMKIDATSSRGGRKDFIDLFFLLKKYQMTDLIGFFERKYKDIRFNKLHILKSLTYFDDADQEPLPAMLKSASWANVKREIEKQILILPAASFK